MEGLTLKEIKIIYGYVYDLSNLISYLAGYRRYDERYDVQERDGKVWVYYEGTAAWKLPVCSCKTF